MIPQNIELNDPIDISQIKLTNSSECNSEELRNIILAVYFLNFLKIYAFILRISKMI